MSDLSMTIQDSFPQTYNAAVRNIYTPSDETFALLFLYKDYDSWLNTLKGTRKRKKFTDSKSGNKEGWSDKGQDLYEYLVSEIEKQREEQQSKDLEIELLKIYQKQNGNHTQEDNEENEESKKEKRQKRQHSLIETLGKGDKDCKFYIKYMKSLPK
eukprot:jgi/Psemu1/40145/gm1.40145_g